MASLSNLPPELTLEILQNFELDKAALCQLTLVSPSFRPLAQQLLLKHLALSVDQADDGSNTQFDKIMQLFEEKPHLSVHVQTLVLSSEHRGPSPNVRALGLLRRLTSLESFNTAGNIMLSAWPKNNSSIAIAGVSEMPPTLSSLHSNPYSRLTRIKCDGRGASISWYGLVECMHLPSIRHVSLVDLPTSLERFTFSEFEGRTCPVRSIALTGLNEGKTRLLKTFLGMASMLEVLEIDMMGRQTMSVGCYTAAEIGNFLVPVRATLRALTIEGPWYLQENINCKLDLSAFERLEKVKVHSDLFFSSADKESSRDGLYTLLPHSLVELQLKFVQSERILVPLSPPPLEWRGWIVNWIMELAANKSAYYPNFGSLFLQELIRTSGETFGSPFQALDRPDLDSLEGLRLEFEKFSIELQIELRMDPRFIVYKHSSLVPHWMLLST